MLATVGGQAFCGERVVLDPMGGVARRDGKRQPATAGTQKPLAAEAACGMLAGLVARGADLTLAEIVQRLWQDPGSRMRWPPSGTACRCSGARFTSTGTCSPMPPERLHDEITADYTDMIYA